jgi:hypothetical protein
MLKWWLDKRTMEKIGKLHNYKYMDTPTLELLEYLHPRLNDFVTHNFDAKWHDKVLQNTS